MLFALCGALIAGVKLADHSPGTAAILLLIFLGLAFAVSPQVFPRAETAAEAGADGRPVVYWRPGCPFCIRLRARLGADAGRLHWVDIWQDPEGAAAVRAITGGDETVPTVVLDGQGYVNPDPAWVREQVVPVS
jgi:mycoredoxin